MLLRPLELGHLTWSWAGIMGGSSGNWLTTSLWNVRNKSDRQRSISLLHDLDMAMNYTLMPLLRGVFLSCVFLLSSYTPPFVVLFFLSLPVFPSYFLLYHFFQYGLTSSNSELDIKELQSKEQCYLNSYTLTSLYATEQFLVMLPTKQMKTTIHYAYRILRS